MNHNLALNTLAAHTVQQALDDIAAALTEATRTIHDQLEAMSARVWDETYATLRANLGTIADARWRIEQLIFWVAPDDDEYGLPVSEGETALDRMLAETEPTP